MTFGLYKMLKKTEEVNNNNNNDNNNMGRDSSVGVATRYRLDGLGIESRWDEIFRICPDRPWGPPSLLYNGFRVFPRVKRPGCGVDHPFLSSVEFIGSRGIPLHPFWAFVACFRVNFSFNNNNNNNNNNVKY